MAIFYFNFNILPAVECDGIELATLAEARQMAVRYAGEVLAGQSPSFWTSDDLILTVSDERQLILFTIAVSNWDAPPARG